MGSNVWQQIDLAEEDRAHLTKLGADLPILADLCRADLAIVCPLGEHAGLVVAEGTPHSVTPLYGESRVGARLTEATHNEIVHALHSRPRPAVVHTVNVNGATVARQLYPVWSASGRPIAVMAADSYWLAYERQRRRSRAFRAALVQFCHMVLSGGLRDAGKLTPFGPHDGVLYVSADRRVRYVSGIAAGLYRQLGYRDNMVGWRIHELDTVDAELVARVLGEQRCQEMRAEQNGYTWLRRGLPLSGPDEPVSRLLPEYWPRRLARPLRPRGAFVLIQDETETLQKQRELESTMSLLREVHHRVKNNLQIIASLMRMQARRAQGQEARDLLEESVKRILSVAVVHEFLSQNAEGTINLYEVAHRILGQLQQGLVDPTKRIKLELHGPPILLPAERVTQCALLLNELVQNAIEHGMAHRDEGTIEVELIDAGKEVGLVVSDDGEGLPEDFTLATGSNLGLNIVRSMVERDLRGTFRLYRDQKTRAVIHFSRSLLGGGN
jgi:two-component sensor histidine kinase